MKFFAEGIDSIELIYDGLTTKGAQTIFSLINKNSYC
jgi:hypothetical protein